MDTFDPEKRSEIMTSIKSKNTGLEKKVFTILEDAGISGFQKHPEGIAGKPDLIFENERIAVFIDSCYWHGCKKHLRLPKSNKEYWVNKIDKNINRDRKIRNILRKDGWSVLRIWEHDTNKPEKIVSKIKKKLIERSTKK